MAPTVSPQKMALGTAEEFKKCTTAHGIALERRVQDLESTVKFRDEAAQRMETVRQTEAQEMAANRAAMETSKSQAQIAWDQHEGLAKQLKEVLDELARAKEAYAKEERDFCHYRRSNNELLLTMHSWSLMIMEALAELKMKDLLVFAPDHSYSLRHYPSFLKLVASLIRGVKGSVSKATDQAGKDAAQQVATRFVAALRRWHLQLASLFDLESLTPDRDVVRS